MRHDTSVESHPKKSESMHGALAEICPLGTVIIVGEFEHLRFESDLLLGIMSPIRDKAQFSVTNGQRASHV